MITAKLNPIALLFFMHVEQNTATYSNKEDMFTIPDTNVRNLLEKGFVDFAKLFAGYVYFGMDRPQTHLSDLVMLPYRI